MVGVEMLMKGLNCVEEQLSLLLQGNTWLVNIYDLLNYHEVVADFNFLYPVYFSTVC